MSTKFTLDELSINSFVEQMNIDEQINLKGGIDYGVLTNIANKMLTQPGLFTLDHKININGMDYWVGEMGKVTNSATIPTQDVRYDKFIEITGQDSFVIWHGSFVGYRYNVEQGTAAW